MCGEQKAIEWSTPQTTFKHFAAIAIFSGKNWSFSFPSPRQPLLLLPHMYRSLVFVSAPKWYTPHVMDCTLVVGLNSFRPKRTGGINVGSLMKSTFGPKPRMP